MNDDDDFLLLLVNKYLHYDPDTGIFTWLTGGIAGHIHCVGSAKQPRRIIKLGSRMFYAHKLAVLVTTGYYPKGKHQVDHIDHDTLNNRINNLRVVTHAVNCKNKSKSKNNTSGVTGVSFCQSRNDWIASININGKRVTLGRSANFDIAVKLRKEAEVKYGYHSNHGK